VNIRQYNRSQTQGAWILLNRIKLNNLYLSRLASLDFIETYKSMDIVETAREIKNENAKLHVYYRRHPILIEWKVE